MVIRIVTSRGKEKCEDGKERGNGEELWQREELWCKEGF